MLRGLAGVVKEGTGRTAFLNAKYTSGGKLARLRCSVCAAANTKRPGLPNACAITPGISPGTARKADNRLVAFVENGGFGAEAAAPIARKGDGRLLRFVAAGGGAEAQRRSQRTKIAAAAGNRSEARTMMQQLWSKLTDHLTLSCSPSLPPSRHLGLLVLFSAANETMGRVISQSQKVVIAVAS